MNTSSIHGAGFPLEQDVAVASRLVTGSPGPNQTEISKTDTMFIPSRPIAYGDAHCLPALRDPVQPLAKHYF